MIEEPLEVLVVEDNPGDVRLIESGLEGSGVERSQTVVKNGEAALDRLLRRNENESRERPDLVLLDLNVPKKTGREVLDRIQEEPELRSIPVVVLTGSQADNHVRETYELGAEAYFVKPADPHEFISLVERLVDAVGSAGTLPSGRFAEIEGAG